jgi:glutaminyl-peptide cyclotransferase
MIRKNIKWIVALILVAMVASLIVPKCANDYGSSTETTNIDTPTTELPKLNIPEFNSDSAFIFTKKQVDMGPRVPGSKAHEQCKNWIVNKLQSYGANVTTQKCTGMDGFKNNLTGYNIIAQLNPTIKKRVVLSSHWDSRRFADQDEKDKKSAVDGADDGASGVGVLIELARNIQLKNPNIGIDIVLFDLEDQGDSAVDNETWCIGSQFWAKNPHVAVNDVAFGILLDMCGAKGSRFTKEGISMKYAPNIVDNVWKVARNIGYYNYFVNEETGDLIDDHKYVNELSGIKMIDIINRPANSRTGFGEYWHTRHDNMDVIDRLTLSAVGNTLLHVLHYEGQGVL